MGDKVRENEVVGIGSAWVNRVAFCSDSRLLSLGLEPGSVVKVDGERYRALFRQATDLFQYAGGSVANTLVALARLPRQVAETILHNHRKAMVKHRSGIL